VKLLQACRESEDEKAEGSCRLQKQSGFRCWQRIVLKVNAAKIQKVGFNGNSSVGCCEMGLRDKKKERKLLFFK